MERCAQATTSLSEEETPLEPTLETKASVQQSELVAPKKAFKYKWLKKSFTPPDTAFTEKFSEKPEIIQSPSNSTSSFCIFKVPSCSSHIKETLYLSLVRPHLEYSCEFGHLAPKNLKHRLEMDQRHAAHFVKNDYWQMASVTAMLKELKWDTIESRRTRFQ